MWTYQCSNAVCLVWKLLLRAHWTLTIVWLPNLDSISCLWQSCFCLLRSIEVLDGKSESFWKMSELFRGTWILLHNSIVYKTLCTKLSDPYLKTEYIFTVFVFFALVRSSKFCWELVSQPFSVVLSSQGPGPRTSLNWIFLSKQDWKGFPSKSASKAFELRFDSN